MPQTDHRLAAKRLREQRAAHAQRIRELADRINQPGQERQFDSEEQAAWEQANQQYNDLTRQIEIHERAADVEAAQEQRRDEEREQRRIPGRGDTNPNDRQAADEEQRALALQAWVRGDARQLTDAQREACERTGVNPTAPQIELTLPDHRSIASLRARMRNTPANRVDVAALQERALGSSTGSAGGFTVPEAFANVLEVNLLAHGPMLQVADLIRTDGGEDFPWPTVDDTDNEGEILGENKQVGTQDPQFAQNVLKAFWFSSKMVRVSLALMMDSAFDMAAILGGILGERLGRRQNRAFTTGVGANEPRGAVTGAALGVTADSATEITPDEVLALQHSVDPAYRMGGRYMMHDNVLLHLRQKKDGKGNYIWQPSMREGEPDRLWGAPVSVNQHMSGSITTGQRTVLYGNFSSYKIRQVRSIVFRRLQERFADYNQEAFLAFIRADGAPLHAGTPQIKALAQA